MPGSFTISGTHCRMRGKKFGMQNRIIQLPARKAHALRKEKVNSAKPIIIQKVNSKISEIPPFDETIHIDTSNTGVPSNLKASVEFSSAQTSISKLSDDTLTLYDPNLDSSCRRLDLPFIMSIRSATKIPIFIDGIPNLDHYKSISVSFQVQKN